MTDKRERRLWALALKVGDTVCTCEYKHRVIRHIDDIRDKHLPNWMMKIIFKFPIIPMFLEEVLTRLFGKEVIVERRLSVEGTGATFSAFDCCDPVDDHTEESHEVSTPSKTET